MIKSLLITSAMLCLSALLNAAYADCEASRKAYKDFILSLPDSCEKDADCAFGFNEGSCDSRTMAVSILNKAARSKFEELTTKKDQECNEENSNRPIGQVWCPPKEAICKNHKCAIIVKQDKP